MTRWRRAGEGGFTLVEMLVTITLLAIVLGTVYRGLNSMQHASVESSERLQNLDEARVLMSTVTKDIRTAVRLSAGTSPFLSADGGSVVFYANLNTSTATSGPNRVTINVDASDRIVEQVVVPTGTAPNFLYTSPATTRVVGRYVANTNSVFTYLDSLGNSLPSPVSATDLLKIDGVQVTIAIRKAPTFSAPTTTLMNRVRLPNLDYNPVAGS